MTKYIIFPEQIDIDSTTAFLNEIEKCVENKSKISILVDSCGGCLGSSMLIVEYFDNLIKHVYSPSSLKIDIKHISSASGATIFLAHMFQLSEEHPGIIDVSDMFYKTGLTMLHLPSRTDSVSVSSKTVSKEVSTNYKEVKGHTDKILEQMLNNIYGRNTIKNLKEFDESLYDLYMQGHDIYLPYERLEQFTKNTK